MSKGTTAQEKVRFAVSIGVFPLSFVLSFLCASEMLARGYPLWLPGAVMTPIFVLLIAVLERVMPFAPEWNVNRGDLRTDLAHVVGSTYTAQPMAIAVVTAACAPTAASLSGWLGASPWPSHWPQVLQVLLALLVSELGMYWLHRLQHEVPWLWPMHAVHHSAPRLCWLNSARFHPVDIVLVVVVGLPPTLIWGCPPEVLALASLLAGVHGAFQHANIDLKLGPLNWVFSMAELHRFHHSTELRESNANYGGTLIFWDILFGTRFMPRRLPKLEVGVAPGTPPVPEGYGGQLLYPLREAKRMLSGIRSTAGSAGLQERATAPEAAPLDLSLRLGPQANEQPQDQPTR